MLHVYVILKERLQTLEFNKQPQFKASDSTVPFIYLTLTTGTVYEKILQTPDTLLTA